MCGTHMNKTIKYYVMFAYWEINIVKITNHSQIIYECNKIPVGYFRAWKISSKNIMWKSKLGR